jgi:hypothetical protein
MNTPKTTAVDWLRKQVQSNLSEPMSPKFAELFDMAREMEREQIEDAYGDGCIETYGGDAPAPIQIAKDYYTKTYGKSE